MDLSRWGRGEKIAVGSSAALLILSFLPLWAKVEAGPLTQRFNAWDFGMDVLLALLLALAVVIVGGIRASDSNVSLPIPAWQIYLGAGALITLLLLIQVIGGSEFGSALGIEVSRGPALLMSPLLGAAVAFGGYLDKSETESVATAHTAPPAGPPAPPPPG